MVRIFCICHLGSVLQWCSQLSTHLWHGLAVWCWCETADTLSVALSLYNHTSTSTTSTLSHTWHTSVMSTQNDANSHNDDEEVNVRFITHCYLWIWTLYLQDAGTKKASLDSMSKEELVGRCKNLLQLAQRAKSAKDGRLRLAPCLVSPVSPSWMFSPCFPFWGRTSPL